MLYQDFMQEARATYDEYGQELRILLPDGTECEIIAFYGGQHGADAIQANLAKEDDESAPRIYLFARPIEQTDLNKTYAERFPEAWGLRNPLDG